MMRVTVQSFSKKPGRTPELLPWIQLQNLAEINFD